MTMLAGTTERLSELLAAARAGSRRITVVKSRCFA